MARLLLKLLPLYIPCMSLVYSDEWKGLVVFGVVQESCLVTAMRKTLNEAGVDDDNIRTEEFSGY
ncbi:MAG TPA: hypothetical protein VGD41_09755 [Pyrinomonadaceae bacterium]